MRRTRRASTAGATRRGRRSAAAPRRSAATDYDCRRGGGCVRNAEACDEHACHRISSRRRRLHASASRCSSTRTRARCWSLRSRQSRPTWNVRRDWSGSRPSRRLDCARSAGSTTPDRVPITAVERHLVAPAGDPAESSSTSARSAMPRLAHPHPLHRLDMFSIALEIAGYDARCPQ